MVAHMGDEEAFGFDDDDDAFDDEDAFGDEEETSEEETSGDTKPTVSAREAQGDVDLSVLSESVSTGILKLDTMLLNGVPRGFTILVEGHPGSGMELVAKQFISGADETEKSVYIATNERTEDVITTLDLYAWPTDIDILNISEQYYETVLLRQLEATKLNRQGLTKEAIVKMISTVRTQKEEEAAEKKVDLLSDMVTYIFNLPIPFRVIIDSLDFFLMEYGENEVMAAMKAIKQHTQANKSVCLMTMVTGAHGQRIESAIRATVDCIINLEVSRMASDFENRLVLSKVRNYPDKTAILAYAITEEGITPERVSRIT